jgi:DNA-binding winged helix-turn-helix (wHTH) protein
VHIANLRRKLEPADGVRLIRTDHRVGYRLEDTPAPVQVGLPDSTPVDLPTPALSAPNTYGRVA